MMSRYGYQLPNDVVLPAIWVLTNIYIRDMS